MARQEFTKQVRAARLLHATVNGVTYCEGCGAVVKSGEYDYDHAIADGLGGRATFENCRVLCRRVCHSAKSKIDDEAIARAKRQQEAHLGIRNEPARKIESRGFPKKAKRQPRPSLPPRQLYRPVDEASRR